jgi:hypothetical protein
MKRKLILLFALGLPLITIGQTVGTVTTPAPEPEKSMEIYGFMMTDVIYHFNQENPNWLDGLRPTKLPIYENDPNYSTEGTIFFGVRQSRFGVKGYTPTKFGELKTHFEFELFGTGVDEGQTTLRLRHAYGQLGKWGVGQTWSPFMDIDVFPNSVEYWGPTGMAFYRNVQVRYMPIQGETFMTIALERPGGSADGSSYSEIEDIQNTKSNFMAPDLSAEYRKAMKWGYLELAGIVRYIGWEDLDTDDGNDLSDNTIGYGLNLSSNIKLCKTATARLGFVYGAGIENYMNDATTDIAVKYDPTNVSKPYTGEVLPMFGGSVFVDFQWNEKFSSSVGGSMIQIDNIEDQSYTTFQTGTYGLANLLYYPAKNMMCGVEIQYGNRENKNEGAGYDAAPDDYLDDATAMRVQFSFKYNFSHTLFRKPPPAPAP